MYVIYYVLENGHGFAFRAFEGPDPVPPRPSECAWLIPGTFDQDGNAL